MNVIISLLIAAWLAKASIEIFVGLTQLIIGILAGLFGAFIYLTIMLADGFAWLWRTAFTKV